jgi:hypothetical protein
MMLTSFPDVGDRRQLPTKLKSQIHLEKSRRHRESKPAGRVDVGATGLVSPGIIGRRDGRLIAGGDEDAAFAIEVSAPSIVSSPLMHGCGVFAAIGENT